MCNLYRSIDLLSSENNSAGKKSEYTLSDNSYTSFNHAKPHVLFLMFMFCLLDRTIQICVSCFRAVQIWCFEYNCLILTTGCSTWYLMAKNLDLRIRIVALHKDSLGYKKFGNSLEPNYSTGQCHTEVFQDVFHSEQASQGSIKEVESSCCVSGAEAGFKKQMHECCQHCFRGCRSGRSACQCSDHTPHTATRMPVNRLLKNHVLWSDESKVNLFGSDGVQQVWQCPGEDYKENCALPTVKHGGGSIMVWGCMTTAGTGELWFIEGNMDSNMYCDILKQKMISPFINHFPT